MSNDKAAPDWVAIEGAYRLGVDSNRAIADRFGVSEGIIRVRAKKHGWVRNAPETKRAIVAAHMAGVSQNVTQDVMRNLGLAADEDIADMERGLRIHRHCLMSLETAAEQVVEPKEIKVIVEATGMAINSIRAIRGLNDPAGKSADDDLEKLTDEELAAEIEALAGLKAGSKAQRQAVSTELH